MVKLRWLLKVTPRVMAHWPSDTKLDLGVPIDYQVRSAVVLLIKLIK
jgi:hypothetical protein